MGINITQFAPPGTVSKLVWDEDMEPGAGKIFKGDLTGNVTGNVTGDLTGNVSGYLTRTGLFSAVSGDVPVITGGTYSPGTGYSTTDIIITNICKSVFIVDDTLKYVMPSDTCKISYEIGGYHKGSSLQTYDANGVLIDSITTTSNEQVLKGDVSMLNVAKVTLVAAGVYNYVTYGSLYYTLNAL